MNQHQTRSLVLVATLAIAMPAAAADEAFVQKAAMGGLAEVDAGSLAQQKGSSEAVKQFGARMVTDHSKTNDELKQIATKKNIAVPSEPDPAHKVAATKLHAKSGAAFDQAFKAQMVADHKATIALFQTEAKSGGDANLKALLPRPCPICRST